MPRIFKSRRLVLAVRPVVLRRRIPAKGNFKRRTETSCFTSPFFIARFATEIFFPQRIPLKIDGRSYSPKVLEKAMLCVARHPAFHLAATMLHDVGDISISGRHVGNLAARVGGELEQQRDALTEAYFDQPLPRVATEPNTPISLACVSPDGGRMQTRLVSSTNGVQEPHWRETKNAIFMRMTGVQFSEDPHPDLPGCFQDRQYMKKLLSGVAEEGDFDPPGVADNKSNDKNKDKSDLRSWRPERVFRTCLSTLRDSDSLGRMMEAEADSRGFYQARKQAFVCDGLAYNWTIQKRHFPTFTPILDYPHVIERVHEAAKAVRKTSDDAWEVYVRWASACWCGRVREVLDEMRKEQQQIGQPPAGCEEGDPRKVLAAAIGYFTNNASRMDYPRYRTDGLPMTSAHMESFVKEVNYRVKGTEKFWNDGPSAEAILQIRAAVLCDDDRLKTHLRSRPGNPFRPNIKAKSAAPAAA